MYLPEHEIALDAFPGFVVKPQQEKPLAKSMLLETGRPQGGVLTVDTMVQKDGTTFINVHVGEDIQHPVTWGEGSSRRPE